ncbi:MAG TPA: twin-arginine translocation signal domain-containing protein, partial [Burkholderiales bacterium]|nr:twin-arginine translocation signal domain-containing protein [Burkholderiales bacterium]
MLRPHACEWTTDCAPQRKYQLPIESTIYSRQDFHFFFAGGDRMNQSNRRNFLKATGAAAL